MSRTSSGFRRPSLAALAASMVLVVAGCGSEANLGGKVIKEGVACRTQVDRQADAPAVPTGVKVAKKVTTKDQKKGTGCAVSAEAAGSFVSMDLLGATVSDGKVFTSTWETKRPITVVPGQNQLIAGLETGLKDLKVGGRRTIVIPAAEGYGKDGNPDQGIGANQDLVFVVELLAVTDTPKYCGEANVKPGADGKPVPDKPTEVEMPVDAPTKLKFVDVEVGTGKAVAKGNYVTLDYIGLTCSSGTEFDSSWGREPASFTVGEGTIEGFGEGMVGLKVGGLRRVEIPWEQGYGATGNPQAGIGPKEPLVFVIKLREVADKAPATTVPSPDSAPPPPEGDASTTTAAGDTTTTAAGSTTTTGADGSSTTTAKGSTTTTAGEPAGATTTTTK